MNNDHIRREFKEFMGSKGLHVPDHLNEPIEGSVSRSLNPNLRFVVTKFSCVHLVSAAASLVVCPQFGFGPFIGTHGLMHFFMYFGEVGCIALCGAFFLCLTMMASFVVMRPEEFRRLQEFGLITYTATAAASLLVFFSLYQLGITETMFFAGSFVTAWLMAAVLAASVSGYAFKRLQLGILR